MKVGDEKLGTRISKLKEIAKKLFDK